MFIINRTDSIKTKMDIGSIFETALSEGKLKVSSKENYLYRWSRLRSLTKKTDEWILKHPKEVVMTLKEMAPQSRRSYMNAVLSVFKYAPELQCSMVKQYKKWQDMFQSLDEEISEKYDRNEPSARQREAYMSWEEVLKKRDSLQKDSEEYLVMMLYTAIPPVRADYGNVLITKKEPEETTQGNYLVLNKKECRMVLNEFKSKGKSLKQYNKVLPKELEEVIRESLKREPRSHLIVGRDGKPYVRDNSYVVYLKRLMNKVLGKNISVSMLRHIYVSSLDMNELTSGEKSQISKDMLHSTSTNDRYRLKFE